MSLASMNCQPGMPSWSMARPVMTPAASQDRPLLISPQPVIAATTVFPEHSTGTTLTLPAPGFSLSPASEPFPPKLVERIQAGHFVEMRDLLTNNISLIQQMEAFNGHCTLPALPGMLKPRLREVSSLASWIYCFLAYVAIRAQDPTTRDMLAYARLLVREAQRHGGSGWLDYDWVFWQQAAIDRLLQWNTLHPGIQAAMMMGGGPGSGTFCILCRGSDHLASNCALPYLHETTGKGPGTNQSAVLSPKTRDQFRRCPESELSIFVSWNKGNCIYPGTCNYRHICATGHQQHMARD